MSSQECKELSLMMKINNLLDVQEWLGKSLDSDELKDILSLNNVFITSDERDELWRRVEKNVSARIKKISITASFIDIEFDL